MTLLLYAIRVIFTRLMSDEPNLHYAPLLTDLSRFILIMPTSQHASVLVEYALMTVWRTSFETLTQYKFGNVNPLSGQSKL
ncbi:hypothetical protein D5F53_14190 [Paenibacillus lautus]|uniref:Uncharacterized protein n=1 Tax=Paenibacillus lautus TaxID=1401 RepID=A0A385TLB2_PAELA|nr:hypothetical protein D5F53_14190 [Paenibacillus lautus]